MLRRSLGKLHIRRLGRLSGSVREESLDIRELEWLRVFL